MIEYLESRRLLSASVSNGTLTITGTDHADRINVVQRGAAIIVHQGSSISRFGKKAHISKILVNALGGNDSIKITSKIGASVDGGDGNDLIVGGNGADVLLGGNGKDRILGQAGNDSIFGGAGKDILFGGAGDDLIDALDTESDQVAGGAGNDSARIDSQIDTAWNIENDLSAQTSASGGALTLRGPGSGTGTLTSVINDNVGAVNLTGGGIGGPGGINLSNLGGTELGGAIAVNGGTLQFTDSTSLAGATMNSGGLFKTGVSTLHLGNGTLNIIQGTLLIDPIVQLLPEAPTSDPAVIAAPEETIVETTPTDSTPPADQTTAPETVAEEPAATDPLA